jgi:hypothetical protein
MSGLYEITPTETPSVEIRKPQINYDTVHDVIRIDGIPFTAEFFFFLTHELQDGDLFEITRRAGAISLRKVILEKP